MDGGLSRSVTAQLECPFHDAELSLGTVIYFSDLSWWICHLFLAFHISNAAVNIDLCALDQLTNCKTKKKKILDMYQRVCTFKSFFLHL